MPRPSQEEQILVAALECFAQYGYEGTRIRQIAERAKVSDGALYRHYASKEELAQALYSHYMSQFTRRLGEIADSGGGVEQRLTEIVAFILTSYRDNPAAVTFLLFRQDNLMSSLPPGFRYPLEIVEGVIVEGQKEKLIRAGQPNLLAAIFLGCVFRPIIVSGLTAPGALDLLHDTRHDKVIEEAAWHAIRLV